MKEVISRTLSDVLVWINNRSKVFLKDGYLVLLISFDTGWNEFDNETRSKLVFISLCIKSRKKVKRTFDVTRYLHRKK